MANTSVIVTTGRFRKIREFNRRRNYLIKKMRYMTRLCIAKFLWDAKNKTEPDISTAKKVLLMRNEGAVGDVVVDTALVKCLYDSGFVVDFLLTTSNSSVVKFNPYIRNIFEAETVSSTHFLKKLTHNVPKPVINRLKKNKYDIIIDPSLFDIPVHRMLLLKQINAKCVISFNKWDKINHYSKAFDFDCYKNHVSQTYPLIADFLHLKKEHLEKYDLHIPDGIKEDVSEYLAGLSAGKTVIINIFAGNADRCMSQEQLASLINHLQLRYADINIVLLDHRKEIRLPLPDGVTVSPFKTLHHMMALISRADLVISPDTAIVHISATWNKPLIAVYKDVQLNNTLWSPGYENASQLIISGGNIHQSKEVVPRILNEIEKCGLLN
jgi:ADP-heptose:LPS heptosyltransferase